MGLGRWWITHGLGSPGSIAKAMATAYSRCRKKYPSLSKKAILFETLRSRYSESEIDEAIARRMVKDSKENLVQLTFEIIHREIPAASSALVNAPDVYNEMIDVVEEITAKFAPGA